MNDRNPETTWPLWQWPFVAIALAGIWFVDVCLCLDKERSR